MHLFIVVAFVLGMITVLFHCFIMVAVIGVIMRIVIVLPVGSGQQTGGEKGDQPRARQRQGLNRFG